MRGGHVKGNNQRVTTAELARRLALALPEATEQDHHGRASFRVRGKIFATVPDAEHLNVMLSEEDIRAAVAEDPLACAEQWWGKRLPAVRVDLARVAEPMLTELLTDAWRRKAPASLVRNFDATLGSG